MRNPGLVILLLVFLFVSCKKKEDETAGSKPLIATVHIPDQFFNPILGGVISVSDAGGACLADLYCQGGGTFTLYGKTGTSLPATIQLTVTRVETYWHSFSIRTETYTDLNPGEFSLQGSRADTLGSVSPVFVNAPAHTDAVLISTSGYSNLTSNPGSIPILLYKNPDRIYISYPTSAGVKYMLTGPFYNHSSDTIDLKGLLASQSRTVSFPWPVRYFECHVKGYPDSNFSSPVPYIVDEILAGGGPMLDFPIHYPPDFFKGYGTEIMAMEDPASDQSWSYHCTGALPSSFRKINASISGISQSGGTVILSASGTMDAVSATWSFLSPFKGLVYWTVYRPESSRTVSLPAISPALSQMFPWLAADSLSPSDVRLYEMPGIDSYSQFISRIFNNSDPTSPELIETSLVQKRFPSKK
jgi:hypothetical protein